ncbi:NADH-quinone oxidoreductase subunit M [Candidatus Reidiella endopervernicosa]|uniref:complex I subunit 4 family protein n=1 Tax=Candidatus Reidiella endopervernicosa TaxID=2738883 RepID=UPI002A4E20D1|nr:NADH-quinone oxidoreductase subunit M [Candidatus Reidiella endopervernicosa]
MLDTVTNDFPILSLMIVSLPVAALLIWLTPDPLRARWIALTAALFDLVLSLIAVAQFNPANSGFQLVERHSWIPTLNVDYLIGVDGISILFLPLTVLLFIGVILASWNTTRTLPRLYFMLLMVLESSVIGIFCALDTMLFFLFWELTLIPTYFLISLWGVGPNRRYAAVKYTLFMMATGVPMLFGFLVLAFNHTGASGLVFDYQTLLSTPLPAELQTAVFFLLLVGFAAKAGVVPFHSWLPTVAMEGPAAITAIMVGLKLGLYGLIRFTIPLAPEAAHEFHWLLAGLGISGVIYGAILALAQSNLRRMLAFSSISHAGLVVLGIASLEIIGLQGALFQLLNFVVVAGGIFLLTGYLHQRIGSTDYASLGGVAKSMPLLAAFYFLSWHCRHGRTRHQRLCC